MHLREANDRNTGVFCRDLRASMTNDEENDGTVRDDEWPDLLEIKCPRRFMLIRSRGLAVGPPRKATTMSTIKSDSKSALNIVMVSLG